MRLITVAILASGFAPGLLAFNASKRESDTCTNNGIAGEMVNAIDLFRKTIRADMIFFQFTRFTGIFFGDFTTTGSQDILGPLAVKGTFSSSTYTVNGNHAGDCSHVDTSLEGYGLVVGGKVEANDVHVHGAIFLPAGSDTSGIQKLDNACPMSTDKGTGVFSFDQAHDNAIYASRKFAKYTPSLLLNADGKLSSIGGQSDGFDVITFNNCNNEQCNLFPGKMSDPKAILFGQGNWNGPSGLSFPSKLIFNVSLFILQKCFHDNFY